MLTYPHLGERVFPFVLFALLALEHYFTTGQLYFLFCKYMPKFREHFHFKVLRL